MLVHIDALGERTYSNLFGINKKSPPKRTREEDSAQEQGERQGDRDNDDDGQDDEDGQDNGNKDRPRTKGKGRQSGNNAQADRSKRNRTHPMALDQDPQEATSEDSSVQTGEIGSLTFVQYRDKGSESSEDDEGGFGTKASTVSSFRVTLAFSASLC
jgi:hypothetical protein